jgi:DNA-binding IclR family transcriptional regulator
MTIQSLLRGLGVLTTVLDSPRPLSLAEVSARTGLNRATVFRMLSTLVEGGYLSIDPSTPVYSAGSTIVRHLRSSPLESVIVYRTKALLEELAAETGETVCLYLPSWPDLVIVAVILSKHPIRRHSDVGDRASVTGASVGRAYLAYAPEEQIDEALRLRPLKQTTTTSVTSQSQFRKHVKEVRRLGYAISYGETAEGMNGLAVPILGKETTLPIAIVSISGPAQRWTKQRMSQFGPAFVAAVSQVDTSGISRA